MNLYLGRSAVNPRPTAQARTILAIQPLLKSIDSSPSGLKKVIVIGEGEDKTKLLTVISLRKCNQNIKKVLPLLIAKHFYHQHKNTVKNPPDKTMHLIIDEAYNILSQQ